MSSTVHDIYDRIAKRCLSLSAKSTVNLINGLYQTSYPPDSHVTYNWTEHNDDELKKTLADTIITINDRHSYHIEIQMTKDGDIIFRVLEYGFRHAMQSHTGFDEIYFPEPLIIYLYDRESFPDQYTLNIHFGTQGTFPYKVPVFKYLEKSIDELNQRKLITLIPFQLLRLRKEIEKERTTENMAALKKLITHDILNSLNQNVAAGNITSIDATKLGRMIFYLYQHIYGKYEELEAEGVGQMAEDALIFDIDILDYKLKQLEREQQKILSEQQQLLSEQQQLLSEKEQLKQAQQELLSTNQELQSTNQELQSTNQELQSTNQELQSTNQELQSTNQELQSSNQIWKLAARQVSAEDIASQLQLPLEEVLSVLNEA